MIKHKFPYYLNETSSALESEMVREIISMTKCSIMTAKNIIAMVKESK